MRKILANDRATAAPVTPPSTAILWCTPNVHVPVAMVMLTPDVVVFKEVHSALYRERKCCGHSYMGLPPHPTPSPLFSVIGTCMLCRVQIHYAGLYEGVGYVRSLSMSVSYHYCLPHQSSLPPQPLPFPSPPPFTPYQSDSHQFESTIAVWRQEGR